MWDFIEWGLIGREDGLRGDFYWLRASLSEFVLIP